MAVDLGTTIKTRNCMEIEFSVYEARFLLNTVNSSIVQLTTKDLMAGSYSIAPVATSSIAKLQKIIDGATPAA